MFCSKEYKTIEISQTDLFNLEATFDKSHDTNTLDQVDQSELKDLLIGFTELRSDILRLLWFIKVKEVGLHKIHAKIERAYRDGDELTKSIHTNLSKINSYLAIRQ